MKAKSLTLKIPITDHYPIFLEIKNEKIINKTETDEPRYGYNYNIIVIFKNINIIEWYTYKDTQDPIKILNNITKDIQSCIEKSKYLQPNNNKWKTNRRKDWITQAIINSCKTKGKLHKKLRQHPNNEEIKTKYKNYVKTLDKIILEAKIKFNKDTVNQNKNDANIKQLKINNTIIHNDKEIANKINQYYCTLGTKLSNNITKPNNDKLQLPKYNTKTFYIMPTSKAEVISIINNLKLKKGGVDNIHAKVLKAISVLIADHLSHLFNLCIERAIWPDNLKMAEVVPIYKAGK